MHGFRSSSMTTPHSEGHVALLEVIMTNRNEGELNIGEQDLDVMETERGLTMGQRLAICFAAGVIGALAVVVCSYVLFGVGVSGALGVKAPLPLKSPDIYRPLFGAGCGAFCSGCL